MSEYQEVQNITNEQQELVDLYLERDYNKPVEIIVTDALKKLDYYDYNIDNKIMQINKAYIINQITVLLNEKNNETLNDIIARYHETEDYKKIHNNMLLHENRASFLNYRLETFYNNLHTFYSTLTVNELHHLGY